MEFKTPQIDTLKKTLAGVFAGLALTACSSEANPADNKIVEISCAYPEQNGYSVKKGDTLVEIVGENVNDPDTSMRFMTDGQLTLTSQEVMDAVVDDVAEHNGIDKDVLSIDQRIQLPLSCAAEYPN